MQTAATDEASEHRTTGWTAILLAGERPGGDPLAAAAGVPLKALVPVAGRPMIEHAVRALLDVEAIDRIVILAQDSTRLAPSLAALDAGGRMCFVRSGTRIASSIAAVAGTADAPWPVLVTTADNALLTPDRVRAFLAGTGHEDIAVGVGERSIVEAVFPETRRTWLKFSDGHYSGANLFALRSARSRAMLTKWAEIESDRKKGLKLIASFGPLLLLRALTRTIGFGDAMARAAATLGCTARPVILDAEAPIDVDKPDDLVLVERILAARRVTVSSGMADLG